MAGRTRHRSSATPLALAYAALVLYASLYPATGWRWPPGTAVAELLVLPWPPWRDVFDHWANFAGYVPLGLLAAVAARRSGLGLPATALIGLGAPALLSWGCEVLQHFVPTRHPSLKDWALNVAGAAVGVVMALAFHGLGGADRWHALRMRWFDRDSAGALALLALWPLALMFPAAVPLGLGQFDERWRAGLAEGLADVPWAAPVHEWLATPSLPATPGPLGESVITALGLLVPCLIAYSIVAQPWRRLVLAAGALGLALAAMVLSTLLNFGPQHAWAWVGRGTVPGLVLGMVAAMVVAAGPRALVVGCGLVVTGALLASVMQTPADPYFAQTLQAWEQGRFVRFHGLAQWLAWLWPYLALGWFLLRLVRLAPRSG